MLSSFAEDLLSKKELDSHIILALRKASERSAFSWSILLSEINFKASHSLAETVSVSSTVVYESHLANTAEWFNRVPLMVSAYRVLLHCSLNMLSSAFPKRAWLCLFLFLFSTFMYLSQNIIFNSESRVVLVLWWTELWRKGRLIHLFIR